MPEASVLTTDIRTSAVNAALANGMFGHADETDDFEPVTKAHPGCAVVPAALAMAEREDRSGTELLRAVTLGYDLCCRFLLALGAGSGARHPSQRRGRQRHVRERGGRGLAGAPRRTRDALRALVRRPAGLRRVELGTRYRARREGLRLRRDGRPQRRHRGDHGPERVHRRPRRAGRRAQRARGVFHGAEARGNGRRSGQPVLRHRDRDQDLFRRLSRFRRRWTRSSSCAASTASP